MRSDRQTCFPLSIQTKQLFPLPKFPRTRYQGSKRKLLPLLNLIFSGIDFSKALDIYSGTGSVSLLLRFNGKNVTSNDYLKYNNCVANLLLNAKKSFISSIPYERNLDWLLNHASISEPLIVHENFRGIFFIDEENIQIDRFCQNLSNFPILEQYLYIYAIGQSLLMKRPYNLFHRANLVMRTRNVERSFGNAKTWSTPIIEHAIKVIDELASFPFPDDNLSHRVTSSNTINLEEINCDPELIYLDPPYLNSKATSVNYADFYHFLEGLCDYSLFCKFDPAYPHKPITRKSSAWQTPEGGLKEIKRILDRWPKSIIVLSYRGDGLPTISDIESIMISRGYNICEQRSEIYKYALSIKDNSSEHILVAYPP